MGSKFWLSFVFWSFSLWSTAGALAFEDSTTGEQETDQNGGFSEADDAALDQETQKMIRKFRSGRASSGVRGGEKSRVSSIFEMHDANVDGISDHANSNNDLEGGQEEAAIGRRGLRTAEREKLLTEAWEKARDACYKRAGVDGPEPKDSKKLEAFNQKRNNCYIAYISPNIVDKGAAHGEGSSHRIYELSEESEQNAKATGQRYGAKAIRDIQTEQGRDASGKDTAPNIDLLRSEAAWLEDQKQMNLRQGWKFLRARRLASQQDSVKMSRGEQEVLGEQIQAIYRRVPAGNSAALDQADSKAAELIAERSAALSQRVCLATCQAQAECRGASAPLRQAAGLSATTTNPPGDERVLLSTCIAANRQVQPGFDARGRIEQARRNLSPEDRRELQRNVASVRRCLKQDAWCKAADGKFVEVKGDPGNAFTDSRELIYHQADKAARGPLNQYMRTMQSADFKPGMKMYNELERDVKEAQRQVNEFREGEKKDPEQRFLKNGNWDPNRQSTNQMSRSARDVERRLNTRTTGRYRARPSGASAPPTGAIPPRPTLSNPVPAGNPAGPL
jgi:hypothetical protein